MIANIRGRSKANGTEATPIASRPKQPHSNSCEMIRGLWSILGMPMRLRSGWRGITSGVRPLIARSSRLSCIMIRIVRWGRCRWMRRRAWRSMWGTLSRRTRVTNAVWSGTCFRLRSHSGRYSVVMRGLQLLIMRTSSARNRWTNWTTSGASAFPIIGRPRGRSMLNCFRSPIMNYWC